jgi:sugar lactone lactonase YvrE
VIGAQSLVANAEADTLYIGNQSSIVSFDTNANPALPTIFANTGPVSNYGLAFDSAGNLYDAQNGTGIIERFTPGGVGTVFATGFFNCYALAFDSSGNLYVAAPSQGNVIAKITPSGVASVFANTGQFGPAGLAFDSAGNLYASVGGDTIEKFTPGGVGSVFANGGGLSNPTGLTFDASGNLYVANSRSNSNSIEKFTPAGVGSTFATTGLSEPFGLAFDSSGNLYAANTGGAPIERFTPSGVGSVFSSDFDGGVFIAISPSSAPEPSSLLVASIATLLGLGYVTFRSRRKARRLAN